MSRVLALALLVLAASCDASANDHPLASVVLRDGPADFSLVEGPASGPMDTEDAITATIADPSAKRRFLDTSGYQGGYSRVWTKDDDYVTVLVHEFFNAGGAKKLVVFEMDALDETKGSKRFSVRQIPGARGYVLTAARRSGEGSLFCQGVWFSAETLAFGVSTCGAEPGTTELARSLAIEQWELAR